MIVDRNEVRIKKIGKCFVGKHTICRSCNNFFIKEGMWEVSRYDHLKNEEKWYYCYSCMKTDYDVLKEIDSDDCPYGIYELDPFIIKKESSLNLLKRYKQTLECVINYINDNKNEINECSNCKKSLFSFSKQNDLKYHIRRFWWDNGFYDDYYCENCAPTKEEALYLSYTDDSIFGIYPIDCDTRMKDPNIKDIIIKKRKK